MEFVSKYGLLIAGIAHAAGLFVVLLIPAWWLAARIQEEGTRPFFRFLCSVGLMLVGYLTFVNLAGRLLQQSTIPAAVYLALNGVAALVLWRRWPVETSLRPLFSSWREWLGMVVVALVIGLPQWILAVSTSYWDETASSAIHLTAANQFAEGVFPPRHNALPTISIKYHYGFTILSGSVKWLTGLSANTSVDVASTALWLFAFLFIVYWLRALGFARAVTIWGGFASLAGGGLAWLYLHRVEAYSGFDISPPESELLHRYNGALGAFENLMGVARVPSAHLRNADGTLSNLPWDPSALFQQHAVALGIALAVFSLYIFVTWQRRAEQRMPLLVVTILTLSVALLGHAVFGAVSVVTGGIVLLILWLREPSRRRFVDGAVFGVAVALLGFLHGGFLTPGAQYGSGVDVLTLRHGFGYSRGGVTAFLDWNLAGFGVPLLLALVAWALYFLKRDRTKRKSQTANTEREFMFLVLSVFTLFSYFIPQFAFYSSESIGVEQSTEISKFFFTAHLGFALLSVYGVALLVERLHWASLTPLVAASVVMPLAFVYVHSTQPNAAKTGREWLGFYFSPYRANSVERQEAEALRTLKHSNRDVYFDASGDERNHGYLSEMLLFGGSVFTLTPTRYERTGFGYRLSQDVVGQRFVQNSRMARLRPGAAEDCNCQWYYSRPARDFAFAPVIIASRFGKMLEQRYINPRQVAGERVLYSIDKPTADLDKDIHQYWRPRVVAQAHTDWDGDGKSDLIFYDYVQHQVRIGSVAIEAPAAVRDEFAQLYVGRFKGTNCAGLLFGRMADTEYRRGRRLEDLVERSNWAWSYRSSMAGAWEPESILWNWDYDIPLVADLAHDGYDTRLMYRPQSGEWFETPQTKLPGPAIDAKELPLPFAGRFLQGSTGDLALLSRRTGMVTIQSLSGGSKVEFKWGADMADVLVPGDYNGDGYDEIASWNRATQSWRWRSASDGAITEFRFGTPSAVPVPADYNHDGRVDPAYWEPNAEKIFVTFSEGRKVDLTIPVPPNSIPAFVNVW